MPSRDSGRVALTRDRRADSLAGGLIVLVVFGHAILVVPGAVAHVAELWLYLFHMPAFVWLSGYLTRYSRAWSVGRLVARLLFPFLVFELIHRVLIAQLTHTDFTLGFPGISWTLWYLVALFVWRLAAVVLVKTWWSLPLAVLLSLAAGLFPVIGYDYSLGRILGFLPYFVLGLLWRQAWFEVLTRFWWIGIAVCIAAAGWAVSVGGDQRVWPFHMAQSYERLGMDVMEGVVSRSLILLSATVMVLSVIAILYRHLPLLESIGRRTLPVYLLHPLVLMPWYMGALSLDVGGGRVVAAVGLGALVFSYVASRALVSRWLMPVADFTWWSGRSTTHN